MLKKHFHKILLCLAALGITSLQAAQKKDDQKRTIAYYNYTLKHSKKKIDNSIDPKDLEDKAEDLKAKPLVEKLQHKQDTVFFTLVVSNAKANMLEKFFFINRDPNTQHQVINRVESTYGCHVISRTTPMLSPHLIFQLLGWMEQSANIYTPLSIHASGPLCGTCHAVALNLFKLNMPTNAKGCCEAGAVELEKMCPLAQDYINNPLTLALAEKILLPQMQYQYKQKLKLLKDFLRTKETSYSPLRGHTHQVNSVAVTHDNQFIVSGGGDNTIRIWDLQTGKEVSYSPLTGHTGEVSSVVVTSDNGYIVSGSWDKTIRIWDFKTGKQLPYSPLKGHTHYVRSVAVTRNHQYIASGGGYQNNTIRIWYFNTGKEVAYSPLKGHTYEVNSVALTRDHKYIVSGSWDGIIRIWYMTIGREIDCSRLLGHESYVKSVTLTNDNKYIVSGGYDQYIHIWDFKTGKEVSYSPLEGHTAIIWSVVVTNDNKYIVSGGADNTIRIWHFNTGKEVGYSPLKGHTSTVLSIAVTHDNKYIISASSDGTIRIWDFQLFNELIEEDNIDSTQHKETDKNEYKEALTYQEDNGSCDEVFDID